MADPVMPAPRSIRVFISSTFADMQAEREELGKIVFPQLRKLCEERGVAFTEVDLRWGVTDEQKAEGQVLPICLAEIQGCRPYFLGLLGQRYGWVPNAIPQALVQTEPWLKENRGRSVTELEILHGVLNDSAMADHVFFYFRDLAYLESLPAEQRVAFTESDPPNAKRLAALKDRIRAARLPVRENYRDPIALGESVLADLTEVIERLFPADQVPDSFERELAEHEAWARSRTRAYVGRPGDYESLDAHAVGEGPPLVVLGESGSGKSALLANWALRYRASRRETPIVMHFVGASPQSTDWQGMVRRIMHELQREMGLDAPDVYEPGQLMMAFAGLIGRAAQRGRVVILIDGLNQLEDVPGALGLGWLPTEMPQNVRLVLSTLPGRPLEELGRRGWPTLTVEPLDVEERRQMITDYLAGYRKNLDAERVARIAATPQASNPLYLRTLLEELRLWGDHLTLDEALGSYLSAETIPDLFALILARYERDYERDRHGLVGATFSLLWAARRGLSEAELRELLGLDGQSLPRAAFSPLYLAAAASLVDRNGLLGFAHEFLRQAVATRYLPLEADAKAAHLRLADYFQSRELGLRKADELPHQLLQVGEWGRLEEVLVEPSLLDLVFAMNSTDVFTYWAAVERATGRRAKDAYADWSKHPSMHGGGLVATATLLQQSGDPTAAGALWQYVAELYRRDGNTLMLAYVLCQAALSFVQRGEIRIGFELAREAEKTSRREAFAALLASALETKALCLVAWQQIDAALVVLRQVQTIYDENGNLAGGSDARLVEASTLTRNGRLEEALVKTQQAERLARRAGLPRLVSLALLERAPLLATGRKRLPEALACLDEAQRLGSDTGVRLVQKTRRVSRIGIYLRAFMPVLRWGLSAILVALPVLLWTTLLYRGWSKFPDWIQRGSLLITLVAVVPCAALLWLLTATRLPLLSNRMLLVADRLIPHPWWKSYHPTKRGWDPALLDTTSDGDNDARGLESLYAAEAKAQERSGDLDTALRMRWDEARLLDGAADKMALLKALEGIEFLSREAGDVASEQRALGWRGALLLEAGDDEQALALNTRRETLCRDMGEQEGLADALNDQGLALMHQGELEAAQTLFETKVRISREIGDLQGVDLGLRNQVALAEQRGDNEVAAALLGERVVACLDSGQAATAMRLLNRRGLLLLEMKRYDDAEDAFQRTLALAREHGDASHVGFATGNLGLVALRRGMLSEAAGHFRDQEKMARAGDDRDRLQLSLGNQAIVLRLQGHLAEASTLLDEREAICRALGKEDGLKRCAIERRRLAEARASAEGASDKGS